MKGENSMQRTSQKTGMPGGTLSILGDSYSTFEGCIPEGQATYYPRPENVPDVLAVEDTWWWQLAQDRRLRILVNDSYSGSTVCAHVRDGQPPESAFIARMHRSLSRAGIGGEQPDVIILFGGTNDSWLDREIGRVQTDGWSEEDLHRVLPAYCRLVSYVKQHNPQARVLCVVNDILKPEIRSGLLLVARHYGAEPVALTGIDKACGHPTRLGMRQIAGQIGQALDARP